MLNDAIVTPLSLLSKLMELIKIGKTDSLTEYVRMTRVEPLVLMDENVLNYPYIEDVLKSLTSIFSGYYLQGVAVSASVGKVNVMKLLDKLSPNRRPMDSLAFATESLLHPGNYVHGLPNFSIATESNIQFPKVNGTPMVTVDEKVTKKPEGEEPNSSARFGKGVTDYIQSASNLSVGVLLEVDIESEGQKATIPITVRLITNSIANDAFVHIFSHAEKKTGFKERYHGWRSGELEFINDIICCKDLIAAHRKALIKDKSGIYREILARKQGNRLSGLFSLNPSVATASNMAVISDTTASALEAEIGGKLDNFAMRQRIFEKTLMMILVVIDPRYEFVTIYHRDMSTPTEISVKGMKHANKGQGMDVAEVLRAFQLGTSPRF